MPWLNYKTIALGDFDVRRAQPENFKVAFVISLPFRLRVGSLYRIRFEYKTRHFDLWLRNRIDIPPGTRATEVVVADQSMLWTDALVAIEDPDFTGGILEQLRIVVPETDTIRHAVPYVFDALAAVNHFIIAYATATDQEFGGRPLGVIYYPELFDRYLQLEVTLVGPAGALRETSVREILGRGAERNLYTDSTITGELCDLAAPLLDGIVEKMDLSGAFIFYELAFEAKARYHAGDYQGALLTAVAALEGAHAAFVNDALLSKIPPESDRNLPEDFLRELGMSLCNQLTPYLLMPPEDRPPAQAIISCAKGLKLRNEIMHALRTKKGEYRMRTRTGREIEEAYYGVLQVYGAYKRACENLLKTRKRNASI